ncbi:hypothetical protein PGT21_022613 [Puccinia graminis f. sp. tritici]|uniref:Uncharacterized protein n=1 Tax=Puccinia graminis f. sp. tritici TaxID=56615 RepID=A0A5B0PDM1_PUCGR|nr:hypothetical protein PGTUg99_005923 [Puccinia graminis f. sp. tritici]KAA1112092.1 hypothetical protein PGT21_022613 [Puccinia graminis f. sp. tritici]
MVGQEFYNPSDKPLDGISALLGAEPGGAEFYEDSATPVSLGEGRGIHSCAMTPRSYHTIRFCWPVSRRYGRGMIHWRLLAFYVHNTNFSPITERYLYIPRESSRR